MGITLTGCRNRSAQNAAADSRDTTAAEQTAKEVPGSGIAADSASAAPAQPAEQPIAEEPVLEMVTSMGSMKIKLYKETPAHRDNFVKLVRRGYYNGLLFHRVIKDFMIQAGDPFTRDTTKTDLYGSGGPNYTIPAEFVPGLVHKKGAVAAARKGDSVNPEKASSGSQFYIVQSEDGCSHLNGEYTVFGEVIDGLNVIDDIASVETNPRGLPYYPVKIISIREINR